MRKSKYNSFEEIPLMLTVEAKFMYYDILPEGGCIDLTYGISIENTQAGIIDYHLDIRAK